MSSHIEKVKEVWVNTIKYDGFEKLKSHYDEGIWEWELYTSFIHYDLIRKCEKVETITIEVLMESGNSLVGVGYISGIEINISELDKIELNIERANVVKEIKLNLE